MCFISPLDISERVFFSGNVEMPIGHLFVLDAFLGGIFVLDGHAIWVSFVCFKKVLEAVCSDTVVGGVI